MTDFAERVAKAGRQGVMAFATDKLRAKYPDIVSNTQGNGMDELDRLQLVRWMETVEAILVVTTSRVWREHKQGIAGLEQDLKRLRLSIAERSTTKPGDTQP